MALNDRTISLELIKNAQQGCEESMSALVDRVKDDIQAYLYRLTLDSHLTEDLYQETMMELVKHLAKLDIPSVRALWGWLYKIAFSKVCRQSRERLAGDKRNYLESVSWKTEQTPSQQLIQKELTQAIYEAIRTLKVSYRNVIALRCFSQLNYNEIANITGGTQMQAKLRFFRAKQALKRQLRKNGFKESHLLTGLALFAILTQKSVKASVASNIINSASLEVGLGTTVVGTAVSKIGLFAAAVIAITLYSTVNHNVDNTNNDISFVASNPSSGLPTHIIKDSNYINPISILKNSLHGEDGWQCTNSFEGLRFIEPVMPEDILIYEQALPGRCLILPAGQWVHLEFGAGVPDGPGVDLFLAGYGLENKPRVALVGRGGELLELIPTVTKDQPTGFTIMAFDLAEANLPFMSSQVRVTAPVSDAEQRPFELRMVRARLL